MPMAAGSTRVPTATAASQQPTAPVPPRRPSAFAAAARPELVDRLRPGYADLGGWPSDSSGRNLLPVVYNANYNISFWGLERLHPFDSKKFQHVLGLLEAQGVLSASELVQAPEATRQILEEVHTGAYLDRLDSSSFKVAQVTELVPLVFLPAFLLRRKVLRPMATMAGGTMLAAALAVEHGWAINLGGGMHHAAHDEGMGWCAYADISLALRRLRAASQGALTKFMIVDLDAHQGNGVARVRQHYADDGCFIVDVYNARVFPRDTAAKQGIDVRRELAVGTGDAVYLETVRGALEEAFERCQPDLVIYNAGTDILAGDPLGYLDVSPAGVKERDLMVWRAALEHRVPVVQLLSGGYTQASTTCIADCIEALFIEFDLGARL